MSAGFPFTGATAAMAVTTNTNPADTLPIPKEWAWNFEVTALFTMTVVIMSSLRKTKLLRYGYTKH